MKWEHSYAGAYFVDCDERALLELLGMCSERASYEEREVCWRDGWARSWTTLGPPAVDSKLVGGEPFLGSL